LYGLLARDFSFSTSFCFSANSAPSFSYFS
jgi:hypothetical protein